MEAKPREIRIYETENGKAPFADWMDTLEKNQKKACGIIMQRIDRVEEGNFGHCEPVGEGVSELKIDYGPGYRIYFGELDDIIILLNGGTKATQKSDIKTAKKLWRDFNAKEN